MISKYRFERIIKDYDLVVVGGGQLLMDNGLVFPSRMYALVRTAYSINKKITIVGVGVGDSWSDTGRDLLMKSISSEVVSQVIVRDSSSLIKLTSLIPEMKFKFEKSYDAAFFSREVFPELDKSNAMSERVGVGVINPAAIHRHSDNEYLASPAAFDFWLQLLVTLTKSGNKVSIFTNGEQGDYVFASLIYDRFISDYPNLSDMLLIEKRPLSLISFVEIVTGYRVIVAARMHSNILAMSLNIPAYALAWDQKISNLYTDIELSDYMSSYSFNANSICKKLQSLESEFIEFESAVSKGIRSDILKKYSISLLS